MYCKVCVWFWRIWEINLISVGIIWIYIVKKKIIMDFILDRVIKNKWLFKWGVIDEWRRNNKYVVFFI